MAVTREGPLLEGIRPGLILLVEDNTITRKMVRITLHAEGYEVIEAANGQEARQLISRHQVDLILLDLILPDVAGVDLVKAFRAMPELADTPIICFSGFISSAEEDIVAGAGFTDFLIKPVEPSKLASMVRNYLPLAPGNFTNQGQGQRVLIVDDDPVQSKLMRLTYESAGFAIETAGNGVEAMMLAEASHPDVIVSDILMPTMDGFQLCYAVRQHPELKSTPILLVSANYVEASDREFSGRLGASGYISREAGVQSIVNTTLEILGSGQAPETQVVDRSVLETERNLRVEHQLVRQAGLHAACVQRAAQQAGILHELSMISEVLAQRHDFASMMKEILPYCLEGAGLTVGALYLYKAGQLSLHAHQGLSNVDPEATYISDEYDLLTTIAQSVNPIALPSSEWSADQTANLLKHAHASSALIVPIRVAQEPLGILILFSSDRNLLHNDWRAFGRSLAAQIAQTITLSRTFYTLSESEQRYRMLFEGSSDGIVMTDNAMRIVDTNPALSRLCGLAREEMLGKLLDKILLSRTHSPERDEVINEFKRNGFLWGELPVVTQQGTERIVQLSGTRISDHLTANIFHDVTEERLAYELVQRLAYTDALTGLANRTALDSRLLKNLYIAESRNETMALVVMDMVDFRVINDTLGHQNGDLLLQQVANRLKAALWESDLVARLGGDEFAVLLTRLARPQHVNIVIEKIEQALLEPFELADIKIDVRMAIGVVLYPDHGEDGDTLLRRADIAMYAAKANQETSALYSPELDHSDARELALISELRLAIQHDGLALHYQPVISIATGKPVGMEALVRWPHPTRGMVFPDQFIPMAEHTGLIHPLTLWVLRSALQQLKRWILAGYELVLSVNLSARDLQYPNIATQIENILFECDVPSRSLILEITESAVMLDPLRAQKTLNSLREFGIQLSVDDFGIGHASLAYLKTLPVHKLKVDKSFVMDLNDEGNAAIVLSVIEMAHRLNLNVTAEGVEDQSALNQLKVFNCDTAQGYFICRPAAADKIDAWLGQQAG